MPVPPNTPLFAVGQYTVSWNSVSLGIFKGEAGLPTIKQKNFTLVVDNSDAYGKTPIEGFDLGAEFQFQGTLLEWKAGPIALLWPFAAALGQLGIIGQSLTGLAKSLVLTAVAGTPAAAQGPATITAASTLLATNFNIDLIFGPALPELPILCYVWPSVITTITFFTKTLH